MAGLSYHSALGEPPATSSDVYPCLYDSVFASERFKRWYRGGSTWQLRIVGGPGSGKTTLSALIVRYLLESFPSPDHLVAAIFMQTEVFSQEAAFVEDFLARIYHQLSISSNADDNCIEAYACYEKACELGNSATRRIKLIRDALIVRLSCVGRAFLVLDDFDRCSPALGLILEQELATLQHRGLSIMVTSRIPLLEYPDTASCDACQEYPIRLYWSCQKCDGDVFIMCHSCKEKEEVCQNCDNASGFIEPYEHIDFELDNIPNESMRKYVAWDLEREHGDLGLGSSNDTKPPLSLLGTVLRQRHGGPAQTLLDSIANRAFGNIALTKLRLDLVHSAQSLEAVEVVGDRLPGKLVALFDAGIRGLEGQSPSQRDLGLIAIAAAARKFNGEPFATLKSWLQDPLSKPSSVDGPPRSREDVLQAVRGFLVADPYLDREIKAYHPSFQIYASERYNESLFWAHSQLRNNHITRSSTLVGNLEPSSSNILDLDESDDSHEPLETAVSALRERWTSTHNRVTIPRSSTGIF